jgi:hypothetical protein
MATTLHLDVGDGDKVHGRSEPHRIQASIAAREEKWQMAVLRLQPIPKGIPTQCLPAKLETE